MYSDILKVWTTSALKQKKPETKEVPKHITFDIKI